MDETDPIENYYSIREELTCYDALLGERPEVVVVTKAELSGADTVRDALSAKIERPVLLVSAVTGQGLNELTSAVDRELQTMRNSAAPPKPRRIPPHERVDAQSTEEE